MSTAGLADAVRAAISTSLAADNTGGLTECRSALVRIFGAAAGVAYRTNPAEVARRRACRSGTLTKLDVLDALMGLPVGFAVTQTDLTDTERTLVDRAPAGAVENLGGQVVRRAVPPVSVQLAVVRARDWRIGLKRAGRFAPFCARAMLLPAQPADWADAHMQASYFGVGVCVFAERTLQMLVEPRPYVRERHTPAQWWFAEEAYRQIKEYESGEERARSTKARQAARPKP